MEGYVINTSAMWMHAMKRSIGPGAKIPLSELFEQYGAKHGLVEGEEFTLWLRNVKLKDPNKWKIVIEDDKELLAVSETSKQQEPEPETYVSPVVKVEKTVADIVGLSVRQAREQLPRVTDLKLLKYAMQEASQLAGKDSLCRVIRKRIRDLQIAR